MQSRRRCEGWSLSLRDATLPHRCRATLRTRVLWSAFIVWELAGGNAHAASGGPEIADSGGRAPPRALQQALPFVSSVDFQDLDLLVGQIRGTVSWTPPADVSEVSGYEVYLTDDVGLASVQAYLGTVAVGGSSLEVPQNTSLITPLGNRSHIFVFTRSPLGVSPQGIGVEICDVGGQDSIFLVNGEASAMHWGVIELSFYPTSDCSGSALRWAQAGSTAHLAAYAAGRAFDGSGSTAWVSGCSSCAEGAVSLGVTGVCRPETVRCVRLVQCIPHVGADGCPTTAGRLQQLKLIVQGQDVCTWRVLKGLRATGTEILEEEFLTVTGRRRRAAFVRFSEVPPRPEQLTNPGFSSR